MELKHAVSFMIGNMGYLGKIFIWMLVCLLVVGALAAAIYIPAGNALENKAEILEEIDHIKEEIELYEELKSELKGYKFVSETDTEVVSALIDKLYKEEKDIYLKKG